MRIVTVNVNGIRAAARKGFFAWLGRQNADVVCIQETKAREEQLRDDPLYYPEGYHCYYFDATSRKGYSGGPPIRWRAIGRPAPRSSSAPATAPSRTCASR